MWIRITLMGILIRLFTLRWIRMRCGSGSGFLFDAVRHFALIRLRIRIQILSSNPWKSAQIGSYSKHFGSPSANWCLSGCGSVFQFSLMRMWVRMRIQATKMMKIHADPDPDPQYWLPVPFPVNRYRYLLAGSASCLMRTTGGWQLWATPPYSSGRSLTGSATSNHQRLAC